MYAPFARNSLANVGSTRDTQDVTRFILSRGVNIQQFEHWTSSLRPFPHLLRRRDRLFSAISLTLHGSRGFFTIKLLLWCQTWRLKARGRTWPYVVTRRQVN